MDLQGGDSEWIEVKMSPEWMGGDKKQALNSKPI